MSQFFNKKQFETPQPQEYDEVMELLQDFCNEVQQVTENKVTCALKPGFVVNFGQEWKATAHSASKGIDHILFRAYVPAAGVPAMLDFYEEQMTECDSPDKVRQTLGEFAQNRVTVETLRMLS